MKNKKIASKIIDYILNVLIVFFVLFLFVSMYTAIQVKVFKNDYADFFGYSMFEVQTGSMHGTIEIGDWIITKSNTDVRVGDIVTYRNGNDYITHRITESYGGTFVTKGDANSSSDDAIDKNQIVGKVVSILHGFGILKKTILNPIVLLLLIVTLYLFNLTFKQGKNKLDIKLQEIMKNVKKYIVNMVNKEEKTSDNKNVLEKEEIKVETIEAVKPKVVEEPIIEEIIDDEDEVLPIDNDEELSKTSLYRVISVDKEEEKKEEEELSKTYLYRNITVDNSVEEEKDDEELSKTSLLRVISVDQKPLIYEEEEEEIKEDKKDDLDKTISLEVEEIEDVKNDKVINKEYIYKILKDKKAKDVVDKIFIVKKTMYDEIMDVLLKSSKAYIYKSSMRSSFINYYINCKYYGTEDDRKQIKSLISDYYNELIKKYAQDENKTNIVSAYIKCLYFISNIEDKNKVFYDKEIKKLFKYDIDTSKYMANDISNIIKYSNEFMKEILQSLDTKTFEIKFNKFENQKGLYGVILNHNISFNKVYSDYIVDKTYNGGIISEDKVAVLLNMLLCRIVSDLMKFDYNPKYFVYLPETLYSKDRKIDKIASIVDNDYSKSHVYFLTKASNMLKNKDDIKRLRKRGYSFACILDENIMQKGDDMGYLYMNDYYFVNSKDNKEELCRGLPRDIADRVIVDDIKKKIGDYGDE